MIICPRCKQRLEEEAKEVVTCPHCNARFPLASARQAEDTVTSPAAPSGEGGTRPHPPAIPEEIIAGGVPPGRESPGPGSSPGEAEEAAPAPSDPACFLHLGEQAVGRCTSCHKHLCRLCERLREGQTYCPLCFSRAPEKEGYVPWEDRKGLGFLEALGTTVRDIFMRPSCFFRRMTGGNSLGQPLLFGVLLTALAIWFTAIWKMLFLSGLLIAMKLPGEHIGTNSFLSPLGQSTAIVFAPVAAMINLFVSSALIHLGVLAMRGRRSFAATFRVICYSSATQLVALVPLLGPAASQVWQVIVIILGLRQAQDLSTGRAVIAALLPIFVFLLFTPLAVVLLLAVFAQAAIDLFGDALWFQ